MSKILIIDDELEICKQVSLILNKNDFNSTYVTSYEEFINLHKKNFDFDLVLVDLWLKNSSKQGIDIINELKNNYNDLVIICTGSQGEKRAAEFIKTRFQEIGLEPKGVDGFFQYFNFNKSSNPHQQSSLDSDSKDKLESLNVIGFIDNKSSNTVVIGAHFDHLGYGNSSSLSSTKEIHNGADDNASGVALMIDLAKKLSPYGPYSNELNENNYLFIAFGAEELGLLGSNYFNKYPTLELESINYMFNFDMVGRLNEENSLAVYGTGTSPIFKQTIKSNNTFFKFTENESGQGPSDHTSFYLNDIPVLHFFTGQHSDYHKPGDDYHLINYDGLNKISKYILDLILDLNDNGKLKVSKTNDQNSRMSPKFNVTLGVMP